MSSEWYFGPNINGRQGPISRETLHHLKQIGVLQQDDLVWNGKSLEGTKAKQIPWLRFSAKETTRNQLEVKSNVEARRVITPENTQAFNRIARSMHQWATATWVLILTVSSILGLALLYLVVGVRLADNLSFRPIAIVLFTLILYFLYQPLRLCINYRTSVKNFVRHTSSKTLTTVFRSCTRFSLVLTIFPFVLSILIGFFTGSIVTHRSWYTFDFVGTSLPTN